MDSQDERRLIEISNWLVGWSRMVPLCFDYVVHLMVNQSTIPVAARDARCLRDCEPLVTHLQNKWPRSLNSCICPDFFRCAKILGVRNFLMSGMFWLSEFFGCPGIFWVPEFFGCPNVCLCSCCSCLFTHVNDWDVKKGRGSGCKKVIQDRHYSPTDTLYITFITSSFLPNS